MNKSRNQTFAGKYCECGHEFESHETVDKSFDQCNERCDCGKFRADENRF